MNHPDPLVNTSQSNGERELYVQAVRIEEETARQAFLDEACGSEIELRQRVEQLLAARRSDGDNRLQRATADSMSGRSALRWDGDDSGKTLDSHREGMGEDQMRDDAVRGRIDVSTHPMIGRYRLLEELGHGGMGTVYMSQQTEPVKRQVALKVIKPGMDSGEVIARFEAERQALAMMDHPHIARVLDGGTTDEGRPYFVMELVRGVPITEFCKRKSLPLRERLELFVDVCHAVQHAHQKGIIHRDLKPGNIMVTLHDGKPVVKVIDFGVAKALHQELTERTLFTHFSQMVGTPLYMAPEQAEMSGLGVDTRSDIYSLGVVLYELLTGTTPFDRDTMSKLGIDGIRKLIQEQEPPRPSARISTLKAANRSTIEDQRQLDTEDFAKQLHREVDWIVMKALEKDRERRYETANAFAADVQRYLNDEPVEAYPRSIIYQSRKLARRYRTPLAVIAATILCLVVTTVTTSWQAIRATAAETDSEIRLTALMAEKKKSEAARIRAEHSEAIQRGLRQDAELAERSARWTGYAVRVKAMSSLREVGDFAELAQSIDQTSPAPGEPDFRGWEWYFHKARLDARVKSLPVDISNATWMLDGSHFILAVRPTILELWDANRLESLARIDIGMPVNRMRTSPSGQKLAIGGNARKIRIVDLVTFTVTGEFQPLEQAQSISEFDNLVGLAWSPDETHIVAATHGGQIFKIRVSDGMAIRLDDSEGHAYGLDWHPDGTRIAVGLWHGSRYILDLQTNQKQWLSGVSDERGHGIRWSPDGRLLAVSEDSLVRVLDDQQRVVASFQGHRGRVGPIVWLDNIRFATIGIADQTCKIWNIEEQQFEKSLPSNGIGPTFIAISPDEQRVISRDQGATQIVQVSEHKPATILNFGPSLRDDRVSGEKPRQPNIDSFTSFAWSQDGSKIIASGPISFNRHFLTVWNAATAHEVRTQTIDEDRVLAYSRDADWLFRPSAEKDGVERAQVVERDSGFVWQASNQQISNEEGRFSGIEFDATMSRLLATKSAKTLGIFDVRTMEISQSYHLPDPVSFATGFRFGPAGRRLLTIGYHKPAVIYPDGSIRASTDNLTNGSFEGAWHVTGDLIAVAGRNMVVLLIDPKTMETIAVMRGHSGTIGGIDFSPDGTRLASASIDGTVRVWDTATGDELVQLKAESLEQFDRVAWSPDGIQIAATTRDQKIFLWSVAVPVRPARLGNAEFDELGMVHAHWREHGEAKQWNKPDHAFGWRSIIAAFCEEFGGFDSPQSRPDIESWVARVVQRMGFDSGDARHAAVDNLNVQPYDYGDLLLALTILCEGHWDDASAVHLADVAIDWLNTAEPGESSMQPRSRLRIRVMLEKAKRLGELNQPSEADQQFQRATQTARRWVAQSPSDPIRHRQRISVQMRRVKYAVDQLDEMLDAREHSIEMIREQHGFIMQLLKDSRTLVRECPKEAYYMDPASSNVSSNVWIHDLESQMEVIRDQIEE